MRISRLRIKNYRCFDDQEIYFDKYMCLVGTNGAGKSTILMALNVLFRNSDSPTNVYQLQEEDFHRKDTSKPVEIICTFADLSEDAKQDFKAYVRQDELVVIARAAWDQDKSQAEVKQFGSRKVMPEFAPYFRADEEGGSANELKEIYASIRENYDQLPRETVKARMKDALRSYEEEHPEDCSLIDSPNEFYGWSKGTNLLRKHVQWVYIPAVKDASEEQDESKNSALGQLLQRSIRNQIDFTEQIHSLRQNTVDQYQALVQEKNDILQQLGSQIENQLKDWAHPGAKVELNWHFDDQKAISITEPFARAKVGEGAFLGELARSGHGMQRSFLVALLQVLTQLDEEHQPTLLLGFEEPELYQHPPQAKHLSSLLEQLSEQNSQIILTSHSPYFVNSRGYENVRMVQSQSVDNGTVVTQITFQKLSDDLANALGEAVRHPNATMAAVQQIMQPSQTELFFSKIPVLVEGPEDVAILSTFLKHIDVWKDFRRLGCHFIQCGGKGNMSRPLAIGQGLGLSVYTIFDGDCDRIKDISNQERQNKCLLNLIGASNEPISDTNVIESNFVMWKTRILDEAQNEIGNETWNTAEKECREEFSLEDGVKSKNGILIAATISKLLNGGVCFPTLSQLSDKLMDFASNAYR